MNKTLIILIYQFIQLLILFLGIQVDGLILILILGTCYIIKQDIIIIFSIL